MSNFNKTDITIILDRSGSMGDIRQDMQGGLNKYIESQKNGSDECNLTVVKFDDEYEIAIDNKPINKVTDEVLLEPRGMTALFDALGKTINNNGERFSALQEHERPGKIICYVVTDGLENSSKEFTRNQVADMIKHQQDVYNWQFIYLGANQDSFAVGHSLNFAPTKISDYKTTSSSVKHMWNVATSGSLCARSSSPTLYGTSLDIDDKTKEKIMS